MIDTATLAYLAGAMDSDGWFGIKKSTYHMRVRNDAHNPVFSERAGLKQVTPDIPQLLKECFGGSYRLETPRNENSKPLYNFLATDLKAAKLCSSLMPYLRIKKRQAELLLELRGSKDTKYYHLSYWFAIEFPNWREMDLVTGEKACLMLGYQNSGSVSQAISNRTLLALPYDFRGKRNKRIPRLLIERLVVIRKDMPPPLVEWRESLWQQVRELNKMGVNGTSVYHRTGHHKPL